MSEAYWSDKEKAEQLLLQSQVESLGCFSSPPPDPLWPHEVLTAEVEEARGVGEVGIGDLFPFCTDTNGYAQGAF